MVELTAKEKKELEWKKLMALKNKEKKTSKKKKKVKGGE